MLHCRTQPSRCGATYTSSTREICKCTISLRRLTDGILFSHRISRFALHSSNPSRAPERHVEDACHLREDLVAVGYNFGPSQVSLIPLAGDQSPRHIDLEHRAHSIVVENRALGSAHPNPGLSCLAPMEGGLRFLSGGYDKSIYLWTLEYTERGYSARAQRLDVLRSGPVRAVAYRVCDQTVMSSAGAHIRTTPISSGRASELVLMSSRVSQIHVHPQAPHLALLEVDHMDRQILLYDTRKAGFNRPPCLEFGYRDTSEKQGSRYVKGSASFNCFGRGYSDGTVRVWDYRNSNNVMVSFQGKRAAPVVHTVLSGLHVMGYGGHIVTYWDLARGN